MFALVLAATLALTEIDVAAREDAEARLQEAMTDYIAAVAAGVDVPELARAVSTRSIALHAIYERDRMRLIDLTIDLARLSADPAADPEEVRRLGEQLRELRIARERYLARRVATELQQQRALAAARRLSR